MTARWSAFFGAAWLLAACGSDGSSVQCGEGTTLVSGKCQKSPTCGEGTELQGGECRTVVPDAGSTGALPFSGVTSVSPASTTSILVTWQALAAPVVSDDADAGTTGSDAGASGGDAGVVSPYRYAIYLATESGAETLSAPSAIVTNGDSFYVAQNLTEGQRYYVIVRALSNDGSTDENSVELSARAQLDAVPPTFAGATGASSLAGGLVHVTWDNARDDLTGPSGIRYLVYASETSPVDTTMDPVLVTLPGAGFADVVVPDPLTPYRFVVRAEDASGNIDANVTEVIGAPGDDTVPPTFAGCVKATAHGPYSADLTWVPAEDDTTPQADMGYTVYAFKTPGPHADTSLADVTQSFVGGSGGLVQGLQAEVSYTFLCRAFDLTGNTDSNGVEVTAATPMDQPPTFGGATGAVPGDDPLTQIVVSWDPAVDDATEASSIQYDIFQALTAGTEDFSFPTQTVYGVTSAVMTLTSATNAYFVVRARDGAGNSTHNLQEVGAKTHVSFVKDLLPACSNCHTAAPFPQSPMTYDKASWACLPVPHTTPDVTALTPGCPLLDFKNMTKKDANGNVIAVVSPALEQLFLEWVNQGVPDN